MNSIALSLLLAAPVSWLFVLKNWRSGFRYLLFYIPFGGIITLSLYPSPIPTLFADIFFVVPLYLAYFLYRLQGSEPDSVPPIFLLLISSLIILALIQSFNPFLDNILVALIGLKVWIFYIPLTLITFSIVSSRDELVSLFRFMVLIAWFPCVFGILTWGASMTFGHTETMEAIYGPAAKAASQNLVTFMDGVFFRIPSTFTFVAQYFGYSFAMIIPAYALTFLEKSESWRKFAYLSVTLITLACLMSGSRGAFLFVPILYFMIFLISGRLSGVLKALILIPLLIPSLLLYLGIDPALLIDLLTELVVTYVSDIVIEGFVVSVENAPLGLGTGMNTGASRYAFEDPLSFSAFENYYAKSIYEFGVLGLIVLTSLFAYIIVRGIRTANIQRDTGLRATAFIITAFIITMCIHSLKGWQLDMVPINTLYWVFVGVLFRIGSPTFLNTFQEN